MIELNMKKEWIGKNLFELKFRKKYSLNVIAIKENEKINNNIDPKVPLNDNMKLIVVVNRNKIKKIS